MTVNQRVRVVVENDRVVVTPIAPKALTLRQRLALFDPERHRGEAMAVAPIGAEHR